MYFSKGGSMFSHDSCLFIWLLKLNWFPTDVVYFIYCIRIDHGFSNGGMHTTAITLTILFWYAALIKKMKYKKVYNLS